MYQGYLIDLDGTMYNGETVIDGAKVFIDRLNAHNIPYLFLTNNATKSQEEATDKLLKMGFDVSKERMYTSSMATAEYLKTHHSGESAYVVGTDSLKKLIENAGLLVTEGRAEVVVMGLDTDVTYNKLKEASLLVAGGASFIATNLDKKFPTEYGFVPGNGSLVQVVMETTNKKPVIIGKPEHHILEAALKRMKLDKENVAMIGDNYDTDIMTGINGGIDTIHVNTGVTPLEDILKKDVKPNHAVNNLAEWSVLS